VRPGNAKGADTGPRGRRILVAAIAAVVVAGAITTAIVVSNDEGKTEPPRVDPHPTALGVPAAQAGCRKVERPEYQGRIALKPEQKHPPYSSSPPTSGWFMPNSLPGAYAMAQPLERVMDIPANGGVAIFATEEFDPEVRKFYNLSHSDDLVTRVYPDMETGVAFVAWGLIQRCDRFSGEAARSFIEEHGKWKAVYEVEPTATPERI